MAAIFVRVSSVTGGWVGRCLYTVECSHAGYLLLSLPLQYEDSQSYALRRATRCLCSLQTMTVNQMYGWHLANFRARSSSLVTLERDTNSEEQGTPVLTPQSHQKAAMGQ
eukprot:999580-Amphidinium_carterae.1